MIEAVRLKVERILWQSSWPPTGPLLAQHLGQVTRESVEDELRSCRAVQARLEAWLREKEGGRTAHPQKAL